MKRALTCLLVFVIGGMGFAQEPQEEVATLEQVLTKKGYDQTAPAVVKLVSDEGRRIGAGVIVGLHENGVGFILTSYSLIAGRSKMAVIVKNHPDPLLGRVVERWIDFETDLAVIAVKNFPADPVMIRLRKKNIRAEGQTYTVVGHTETEDWIPIPVVVTESDERHVALSGLLVSGIEGAPLLDHDGSLLGLVISHDSEEGDLTLAIKNTTIKPILDEWFKPIPLVQKWQERGSGLSWVWAVGGGVLGASIATVIALSGGGEEAPAGLPQPPLPPNAPGKTP